MTFVKSKSKYDSACKAMGCENKITVGSDYIYDTEGKIAYCLNHDEVNSKVVEKSYNKGGGYYKWNLEKAPEILNMSIGFADSVRDHMSTDIAKIILTPADYCTMVESFFKTMSQSYKGE